MVVADVEFWLTDSKLGTEVVGVSDGSRWRQVLIDRFWLNLVQRWWVFQMVVADVEFWLTDSKLGTEIAGVSDGCRWRQVLIDRF